MAKKAPLGAGKRFAQVKRSVAGSGVRDPAAVAAAIGREKWGQKRMTELSQKGRRRAKREGS